MKAAVLLGVLALIAAGFWWYRVTSSAAPSSGTVAIVDVPGDYSTCTVGVTGSYKNVPCPDVGSYLRNTLKLGSDAGVLVRPRGSSSPEVSHAMTEEVHAAGYLIVPYMGDGIGPEMVHGDR